MTKKQNLMVLWGIGIPVFLLLIGKEFFISLYVYHDIEPDPSVLEKFTICSVVASGLGLFGSGICRRCGIRIYSLSYLISGLMMVLFGIISAVADPIVSLLIVCSSLSSLFLTFGACGIASTGQRKSPLASLPYFVTSSIAISAGGFLAPVFGYPMFFLVSGIVMVVIAVLFLLFLKDDEPKEIRQSSFREKLASVLNRSTVRINQEFSLLFGAMMIFASGFLMYFIRLGNYLVYNLGFTEIQAGFFSGIGFLGSCLFLIAFARIPRRIQPAIGICMLFINLLGLFLLFSAGRYRFSSLLIGLLFTDIGGALILQTLISWTDELLSQTTLSRGAYIRNLLFSLAVVPLLIGSFAADFLTNLSTTVIVNEKIGNVPPEPLFFFSGALIVISIIPLYMAYDKRKTRIRNASYQFFRK